VAHLAAEAGESDALIVPFPDPVWDYYTRPALGLALPPRHLLPATAGAPAAETEAALAELADDAERLWFVPYEGWDADRVVERWLSANTLSEARLTLGRTELRAYRPLAAAEAAMQPVDAQVGDQVRLVAAHVTADGRPLPATGATVPAGATLEVTLLWEALGPIPRSLTVFVHLRDAAGALIAQHDGIPLDGTRPTTLWQSGERLLDRHTLTVPPGATGAATLVVGLYDSETVEPQPFDSGATDVILREMTLQPGEPDAACAGQDEGCDQ
jgi:hypothetical protein